MENSCDLGIMFHSKRARAGIAWKERREEEGKRERERERVPCVAVIAEGISRIVHLSIIGTVWKCKCNTIFIPILHVHASTYIIIIYNVYTCIYMYVCVQYILTVAFWPLETCHAFTNRLPSVRSNTPAVATWPMTLHGTESAIFTTLWNVVPGPGCPIVAVPYTLTNWRHLYGGLALVTTPIGTAQLVIRTTHTIIPTDTHHITTNLGTCQCRGVIGDIEWGDTLLSTSGTRAAQLVVIAWVGPAVFIPVAFWLAGWPLCNYLVNGGTEHMLCS